jgi:hypothetical protein
MAAFRFLALLTVGFILLVLSFLLHAGHSRLEREGTRVIQGPELAPRAGESVIWTVDFAAQRVEQAWPGVQRQPRLYLEGADGRVIEAEASYVDAEGRPVLDAFVGGGPVEGAAGEGDEVAFGALWMSWEHPLRITLTVLEGGGPEGGTMRPVLRGKPGKDFIAARAVSRTLWLVFTIIGLLGFAGLAATQGDLFRVQRGEAPQRS